MGDNDFKVSMEDIEKAVLAIKKAIPDRNGLAKLVEELMIKERFRQLSKELVITRKSIRQNYQLNDLRTATVEEFGYLHGIPDDELRHICDSVDYFSRKIILKQEMNGRFKYTLVGDLEHKDAQYYVPLRIAAECIFGLSSYWGSLFGSKCYCAEIQHLKPGNTHEFLINSFDSVRRRADSIIRFEGALMNPRFGEDYFYMDLTKGSTKISLNRKRTERCGEVNDICVVGIVPVKNYALISMITGWGSFPRD
jgi:hypothetical protein